MKFDPKIVELRLKPKNKILLQKTQVFWMLELSSHVESNFFNIQVRAFEWILYSHIVNFFSLLNEN